jgi:hypothetical protein
MVRSVQITRLLAAVAIAASACLFVKLYDGLAYVRYPFDHPEADGYRVPPEDAFGRFEIVNRPYAAKFVTAHRTHAFMVPLVGLLLGVIVIWRWPDRPVLIELVVASLWVLAFLWAWFVLVVWQLQNMPIFHGSRWHY